MGIEEREAAIIAVAYTPGYAHAENVLLRLRSLEESMPYADAIDVLHREVCDEQFQH